MNIPEDGAEIFKAVVNSHNAQLGYIRKLEAVVEQGKALADYHNSAVKPLPSGMGI